MGLPPNDPLRFDASGNRLSKEELDTLLSSIIESWPKWDWKTTTSSSVDRLGRRSLLSGERHLHRQTKRLVGDKQLAPGKNKKGWLSR